MKDFSLHLSVELMKLFGEPYSSSITTVRRFGRGDIRVYVDYERERDDVHVEGFVANGGVVLQATDFIAFLNEISRLFPTGRTFRIHPVGKYWSIIPTLAFGIWLKGTPDDKKIPRVVSILTRTFAELERMEQIIQTYKKKAVGYSEVKRIWQKAMKTEDRNKKGKLLEEALIQLIQIDGNFVITGHNVRTQSEEIDISVQPDSSSPFWSRISPPLILLECKNWKDKVGVGEIQKFSAKVENRPKLLCRIGFIIAVSGFTGDALTELVGYRGRDFVIATITGHEIQKLIKSEGRVSDLLYTRLIEAGFR